MRGSRRPVGPNVLAFGLEGLPEIAARELLQRRGVSELEIPTLLAMARGVPLALMLVTPGMGAGERAPAPTESTLLAGIAERSVEGLSPELREAVEVSSLVRRATRPLLQAMLGKPCPDELLAELGQLSFVELVEDGLTLHEPLRHATATRLRALDPVRCATLRVAVWHELERSLAEPVPRGASAWRLMADLLFLVEHPEIREAFFPTHDVAVSVSAAELADAAEIFAISERHDPPELVAILNAWWRELPSAFRVARDRAGGVIGFAVIAASHDVPSALAAADPLLCAWQADLAAGAGKQRGALLVRRCLSRDFGEAPSDVRAAVWLDVKRDYVSHPESWGVYSSTRRIDAVMPLLKKLGFRQLPFAYADESTVWLEFGSAGVWSWLRRLLSGQVGVMPSGSDAVERGFRLDTRARPRDRRRARATIGPRVQHARLFAGTCRASRHARHLATRGLAATLQRQQRGRRSGTPGPKKARAVRRRARNRPRSRLPRASSARLRASALVHHVGSPPRCIAITLHRNSRCIAIHAASQFTLHRNHAASHLSAQRAARASQCLRLSRRRTRWQLVNIGQYFRA